MRMRSRSVVVLVAVYGWSGWLVAAEPEKLPLWNAAAPLSAGQTDADQPFLVVHPAAQDRACGAAFVICPGGGYGALAADHEGTQVARWCNGVGATAFVLHYRLGSKGYHHPVQLIDVQRAIRLVRSTADDHGIDPQRIGIIGFSAGGHLASMATTLFEERPEGATSDAVDAVSARPDVAVLGYPVISLAEAHAHRGSRKNLLGPAADDDALARRLSTDGRVTAATPPTFLFQTDEDTAVPAENAVAFYLACRRARVPAELHAYERGPHGVGLALGDPVLSTWSDHLRDWLRNRGFLRPSRRVAVKGRATVAGKPVSWGMVAFTPDDPLAPVAAARIRNGDFSVGATQGPVAGPVAITVTYSAADVPGTETATGVVTTKHQHPGAGPWRHDFSADSGPLALDITP